MVECLTQDRGAAGSSLTGVTVLSLSKTHLSLRSTCSTQEGPSGHNGKIVYWDVKNQIKQSKALQACSPLDYIALSVGNG